MISIIKKKRPVFHILTEVCGKRDAFFFKRKESRISPTLPSIHPLERIPQLVYILYFKYEADASLK